MFALTIILFFFNTQLIAQTPKTFPHNSVKSFKNTTDGKNNSACSEKAFSNFINSELNEILVSKSAKEKFQLIQSTDKKMDLKIQKCKQEPNRKYSDLRDAYDFQYILGILTQLEVDKQQDLFLSESCLSAKTLIRMSGSKDGVNPMALQILDLFNEICSPKTDKLSHE